MPRSALVFALLLSFVSPCISQEQRPEQTKSPEASGSANHPAFVPPSVRLKQAKTVFVKNAGGSDIPFNVIEGGIEGWGRYMVVDSPEKADLIVEVNSPSEDTGVTVTSKTSTESGHMQQSTKTSRELNVQKIKLTVLDARNHVPLWSATEQPKGAFREKNREDNLVESAQKLVRAFRNRVEPEAAK